MRAGLRTKIAAAVVLLSLVATASPAQDTSAPADAPATVGPRELQNFSLEGTVTREAEPPPAPRPQATPPAQAPSRSQTASVPPARPRPDDSDAARPAPAESLGEANRPSNVQARSLTVPLAPAGERLGSSGTVSGGETSPNAALPSVPLSLPGELPEERGPSGLPWRLALVLLAVAAGAYALRQRSRGRLSPAGGAALAYVAPERAPSPRAAVPPRPAGTPPTGVVSTRLRPRLEIDFKPLRCDVDGDKATIHFEMQLFNAGSSPAREVLVEAAMFNAGASQDEDIRRFFDHPVAKGERLPVIQPLKRVALASSVHLSTEQLRVFKTKDRRFFVPLVGFNALYSWSGGEGQTSASYLVGRDTKGEKLAPFRLDLGNRMFGGLAARENAFNVRT